MKTHRPTSHWVLLLSLVAMWGSSFMFTKIAVQHLPPALLVTMRMLLAATLLLSLAVVLGLSIRNSLRHWVYFLLLAITGSCLPFFLISWGQQRIDSGLAGILMAVMPLTTIVLAHFFVDNERLTRTKVMGFVVGFCGILVLVGPEALGQLRGAGTPFLAQLAVLGGALSYAVTTILARRRPSSDPLVSAASVALTGALIMLPFGAGDVASTDIQLSGATLISVLFLGLVSTGIAQILYFKLIAEAGPSFFSNINYLIPVWAVFLGVAFLHEQLQWRAVVALAMVLGGIALAETAARRRSRSA